MVGWFGHCSSMVAMPMSGDGGNGNKSVRSDWHDDGGGNISNSDDSCIASDSGQYVVVDMVVGLVREGIDMVAIMVLVVQVVVWLVVQVVVWK